MIRRCKNQTRNCKADFRQSASASEARLKVLWNHGFQQLMLHSRYIVIVLYIKLPRMQVVVFYFQCSLRKIGVNAVTLLL